MLSNKICGRSNLKDMKISIIIRTYNEEKWIESVLKSISNQKYSRYEIIIVDSESTDKTLEICEKYNCKIIKIKKSRFNYSYASNVGAENSSGEILCYLSGHSVPVNDDYLKIANDIFENDKVGGAYGEVIALPDGTLIEKLFNNIGYKRAIKRGMQYEKNIHPGILSCSNALIRRDLWEKHKFKEVLGKGGEDVELAYRILNDGFNIIKEPNLLVMHSHGSKLFKFIKEFKGWRKMYKEVEQYIKEDINE